MAHVTHLSDAELMGLIEAQVVALADDAHPLDPVWVTELVLRYRDVARLLADPGASRLAIERLRQMGAEGYAPSSDDSYVKGELYLAAESYLMAVGARKVGMSAIEIGRRPPIWPWADHHWKPKSNIRDLERAGALIAAELSRRIRAQDAFLELVVTACVAGGADRDHAAGEVAHAFPDWLEEKGIEIGDQGHDWGVSGAAALADELVLRHLEAEG